MNNETPKAGFITSEQLLATLNQDTLPIEPPTRWRAKRSTYRRASFPKRGGRAISRRPLSQARGAKERYQQAERAEYEKALMRARLQTPWCHASDDTAHKITYLDNLRVRTSGTTKDGTHVSICEELPILVSRFATPKNPLYGCEIVADGEVPDILASWADNNKTKKKRKAPTKKESATTRELAAARAQLETLRAELQAEKAAPVMTVKVNTFTDEERAQMEREQAEAREEIAAMRALLEQREDARESEPESEQPESEPQPEVEPTPESWATTYVAGLIESHDLTEKQHKKLQASLQWQLKIAETASDMTRWRTAAASAFLAKVG